MPKKKKHAAGGKETSIAVRGHIVVSAATGRPVYLPSHPEGISEVEANRLSDGLLMETKVVPFNQETD